MHQREEGLLDEQLSVEDDQLGAGGDEIVTFVELEELDEYLILVLLCVCVCNPKPAPKKIEKRKKTKRKRKVSEPFRTDFQNATHDLEPRADRVTRFSNQWTAGHHLDMGDATQCAD